MTQWARLPNILLAAVAPAPVSLAQLSGSYPTQPAQLHDAKTNAARDALAQSRDAAALLDQVLAGVKDLALPQNRIAIESEAFPILWGRNHSQGRALVNQIAGDFAQATSEQDENTSMTMHQMLRQQWLSAIQTIAQSDADSALTLLATTRSSMRSGSPDQDDAEDRQLRLNLAAQQAAHNPQDALKTAEKELAASGPLSFELINVLQQVTAADPEAGSRLLNHIARRLNENDLASGGEDFNFAINLLGVALSGNAPPETSASDNGASDALKGVADAIVSATLSPLFPRDMLGNLQGSLSPIDRLVPGKAQALREKVQEYSRSLSPEQRIWQDFNQLQQSGSSEQLLAIAARAPANVRPGMYQQVAARLANEGDMPQAIQVAENVSDPVQRHQILQQAIRQAAWAAANKGEFAAARQLSQQIVPGTDRASTLAQLALNAFAAKQTPVAQEMLEDATSLLPGRPQSAAEFSAQMQVAQAFIQLKSDRGLPLLERSADQMEQVLAAAAQLDGFMPYQCSFEKGELILGNSFFFNSLIQPYAQATAELASYNLPAARALASRLQLPEARLMAELYVARNALAAPAQVASRVDFRLR